MEGISTVIEYVAVALELVGVGVIALGALYATVVALRSFRGAPAGRDPYNQYREQLGRAILLGLEFLVAGDIISTVAVEPTFRSVGVLAIIVAVRTFLSFTLEVEMTGRWPWHNGSEKHTR